MKVIYKKKITHQIRDAVEEAKQRVQVIDYIELTNEEFQELRSELLTYRAQDVLTRKKLYNGIKIVIKEEVHEF